MVKTPKITEAMEKRMCKVKSKQNRFVSDNAKHYKTNNPHVDGSAFVINMSIPKIEDVIGDEAISNDYHVSSRYF